MTTTQDLREWINDNNLQQILPQLQKHCDTNGINWVDGRGNTALHYAASQGNTEIVRWLLQEKAKLDIQNHYNQTPLQLAALNNQLEIVRLLSNISVNPSATIIPSTPPKTRPPQNKPSTQSKNTAPALPAHTAPKHLQIHKLLSIPYDKFCDNGKIIEQISPPHTQQFTKTMIEKIQNKTFQYSKDVKESLQHTQSAPEILLYLAWAYSMESDFENDFLYTIDQYIEYIQQNPDCLVDALFCTLLPRLSYVDKKLHAEIAGIARAHYPNNSKTSSISTNKSKTIQSDDLWQRLQPKLDTKQKATMEELFQLTGIEEIKKLALRIYEKALSDAKIPEKSRVPKRYNFAFMGNPGTGKTVVARLFTRLLHEAKIRKSDKFKETSAQELLNLGAKDFEQMITDNKDGVIFIDEAYALQPNKNSIGKAIVDLILQKSEELRDSLTFILAGYQQDIENELYSFNIGLKSRFEDVYFPDFSKAQLAQIWQGFLKKYNWKQDDGVEKIAINRLAKGMNKKGFSNARSVRNLFEKSIEEAQMRGVSATDLQLQIVDIIGPPPTIDNIPELKYALAELDALIGLSSVKKEIQNIIEIAQKNHNLELAGEQTIDIAKNCCFIGNPGTGKTTVAKIYGRIFTALRLLSKGDVDARTASDFIGSYIGQSQERTKNILEMSQGKVLLIDEAYALNDGNYGKSVLDTIVEKNTGSPTEDIAIILCGYQAEIQDMLNKQNPGLQRRFAQHIHFEDFTNEELLRILKRKVSQLQIHIPNDIAITLIEEIAKKRNMPHFGNAGMIDTKLTEIQKKISHKSTKTIAQEDIWNEEERTKRENPFTALQQLTGSQHIIEQLEPIYKSIAVYRRDGGKKPVVGNFIFTGNAGTGKTTIAQKMGDIFCRLEITAHENVHVVTGKSLTGNVVGETKDKVNDAMIRASGGILFIDEAYDLGKGYYGEEALTTLLALLTDPRYNNDKTIVILAGYANEISAMLSRNQGLIGRFANQISFADWSTQQCIDLLQNKAREDKFEFDPTIATKFEEQFAMLRDKLKGWANARDVITIYESAIQQRSTRVYDEPEKIPSLLAIDIALALEQKIKERIRYTELHKNSSENTEKSNISIQESTATNQKTSSPTRTQEQQHTLDTIIPQKNEKNETEQELLDAIEQHNQQFTQLDLDILGKTGKLGANSLEGLLEAEQRNHDDSIEDFLANREKPENKKIIEQLRQNLLDIGADPNTIDATITQVLEQWQELRKTVKKLQEKLEKKQIKVKKSCGYCGRPWGRGIGQCMYMGPIIEVISDNK